MLCEADARAGELAVSLKGDVTKLTTCDINEGEECEFSCLGRLLLPCVGDGESCRFREVGAASIRATFREDTAAVGENEPLAGDSGTSERRGGDGVRAGGVRESDVPCTVGPLAGKLALRFKGVIMKLATREMTDGEEHGDSSLARLLLPCTGDGERSLFKRTPLKEETCEASNANAFGERDAPRNWDSAGAGDFFNGVCGGGTSSWADDGADGRPAWSIAGPRGA